MRKLTLLLCCWASMFCSYAEEGMWLPFLLENNIGEMSEMGLHLSADDIYNINQSCLKDAVVGFVDLDSPFHHFCSGSVISSQGLVITNHHCGLDVVRQHSSLEDDYIADGFWAMRQSEELGNNNIGVCFLRRMEDVTSRVLEGVADTVDDMRRKQLIESNMSQIENSAVNGTAYKAKVDAFYCSNEYYLSVYEIFEDVRLVGAPPISIGKFGGDTDNWSWPRHTGDFTLFRIYADSANRPVAYSDSNVPYHADNYLKINAGQKSEGDFTMLMGYPGTTREYLPSFSVLATQNVFDPFVIAVRGKSIDIIKDNMRGNKDVTIKYTSKVASLANTWKKMQGEVKGLRSKHVADVKKLQESQMTQWIDADSARMQKYSTLLADYEKEYSDYVKYEKERLCFSETVFKSEMISVARRIRSILNVNDDAHVSSAQVVDYLKEFFADYDLATDKAVTAMLLEEFVANVSSENMPISLRKQKMDALVDDMIQHSFLINEESAVAFFLAYTDKSRKRLESDLLYKLADELSEIYSNKVSQLEAKSYRRIGKYQQSFMQMQREYHSDKKFFPDANSTFRIAYGVISGFNPANGVHYSPFTTLDGVLQKCDMDIYDYVAPERLKQLYATHDYGPYANADGTMPVCFLSTCHTTGGNSGSPMLDADGCLIGLNFDRVWEGTMSDIQFDADICRNIGLDIRYALFIIDKYANARHLVDEMEIIGLHD